MCMALTRRLQLLLDEERYQRISDVARHQRISVAAVIRDAIDRGLTPDAQRRRAAGQAILSAPEMEVPDIADLRHELDDMRGRRG